MQCGFCNKQANTVRALVFAPSRAAICDECVDVCNDIIHDDDVAATPRLSLPAPSEIDDFIAALPNRSWEQLARLIEAANAARRRKDPEQTLHCSFCDEPEDRVGQLIACPGRFICDACIALCNKEIAQTRDGRLVELSPPQRNARTEARALSAAERALVLDGVRADFDRRRTTILAAMQIAATHADGPVPCVEGTTGDDPVCECPVRYRELINSRAATWIGVCLEGGTSVLRRGLARRMHECSGRADRPLVVIDCRAPGALAGSADLDHATVFLDHIEVLSAQAQEFLWITLCSDGRVPDTMRVVTGAGNGAEFAARVNDRRFSKLLSKQFCAVHIDLDGNQPPTGS